MDRNAPSPRSRRRSAARLDQSVFEEASRSAHRVNLALVDASILLLQARDPGALSAARQIAAVAAEAAALATRMPGCAAQAAADGGHITSATETSR